MQILLKTHRFLNRWVIINRIHSYLPSMEFYKYILVEASEFTIDDRTRLCKATVMPEASPERKASSLPNLPAFKFMDLPFAYAAYFSLRFSFTKTKSFHYQTAI
nr:hypothetical protein Iba_chr06dCG3040 [Ipomoea batatas]